nr:hypothetical protein DWF04_08320 [Cereibacter sphaeroides f. sp. denitrificans]
MSADGMKNLRFANLSDATDAARHQGEKGRLRLVRRPPSLQASCRWAVKVEKTGAGRDLPAAGAGHADGA